MEDNAELESFRNRWREEVKARARPGGVSKEKPEPSTAASASGRSSIPLPPSQAADRQIEDYDDGPPPLGRKDEIVEKIASMRLDNADDDVFGKEPQAEPRSALEHYEKAVEKEAQGSLGDSLSLYRKAYRLDSNVDKTYRKKFFPPSTSKLDTNPSNAPVTVPNTAHHSSEEGAALLPTAELIASFASLSIPPADPIIEGTPPPPCPMAHLPSEVVIEILRHIAIVDPAMLSRVSLVCKRFAYHVAYEQRVWKRLCQGPEFGFGGMHYSFACDLEGKPHHTFVPHCPPFSRGSTLLHPPKPLRTWNQVFQSFPRIRFTGIYISTVNYSRPGAASVSHTVSWNTPIHIVTYYRYLRFYRDGTVISLLTTTEPVDVVPHISKENVLAARASLHDKHRRHISRTHATTPNTTVSTNPIPPAASAAIKHGLRGRWHLTSPTTDPTPTPDQLPLPPPNRTNPPPSTSFPTTTSTAPSPADPRDLVIETEGVDPKYTYAMHLTLRSSSSSSANTSSSSSSSNNPPTTANGPKNTKLAWKGFWSYNCLTDDWAEFGLRNDRAFVFRRVRGWGME